MHKIILKKPDENPMIELTKNVGLEYLQKKVDGYIDIVRLPNNIDLVINDEALLIDNPQPNFRLFLNGYQHDIYGPVAFTSYNDDGDSIGLSDEQISILAQVFKVEHFEEIQFSV